MQTGEFDLMVEHRDVVSGLVKDPAEIIQTLDVEKVDLLHGAIGVVGEIGEIVEAITGIVDTVNLVEELGDIEFYMAQIRERLVLTYMEPERGVTGFNFHRLVIHGAHLLDLVKKVVIYNKTMTPGLLEIIDLVLYGIDVQLNALREAHGINRMTTLQGNIDKLGERYPNFEYTDQRAEERADKQG